MDRGAWWATVHGITKESKTTEWLPLIIGFLVNIFPNSNHCLSTYMKKETTFIPVANAVLSNVALCLYPKDFFDAALVCRVNCSSGQQLWPPSLQVYKGKFVYIPRSDMCVERALRRLVTVYEKVTGYTSTCTDLKRKLGIMQRTLNSPL